MNDLEDRLARLADEPDFDSRAVIAGARRRAARGPIGLARTSATRAGWGVLAGAAALGVAVVALPYAVQTNDPAPSAAEPDTADSTPSDPAAAGSAESSPDIASASPLDAIPGFGRGPDALLRDDAISAWEEFGRSVLISDCMAEAGFERPPSIEATRTERHRLLTYFGLSADAVAADGSVSMSNPALDAPTPDGEETRRPEYRQALYGLTPQQQAEGSGDIRKTGCFADALRALPGLTEMGTKYGREVTAARFSHDDAATRERRESAFIAAHPELLEHARAYASAWEEMRADEAFVAELRR